jgi:hypothetical protein
MVLRKCHPDTNVEFPLEDKKRLLDVLLNDEGVVFDFMGLCKFFSFVWALPNRCYAFVNFGLESSSLR